MNWLKRLLPASTKPAVDTAPLPVPTGIVEHAGEHFALAEEARWHDDLPHPDFLRAREWVGQFDDDNYGPAWLAVQRTWLTWLAAHFGDGYRLHESADALLLTDAEPRAVKVALDYLTLSQRRVARSLQKLATERLPEKQVVLLLHDEDQYYRYLSGMYPEDGEFPMSAGVHFNGPAPHFVVNGSHLDEVEATIVHEMTHAFVAHLPIPAWLNEGLAVNMEIAFGRVADGHKLIELEKRQRRFWTPDLIQDYWSGRSWHRADEGNELSYDLGRLMVAGMSEDWSRFEAFALAASGEDSGARAAKEHLGICLGEYVRHYLERTDGEWGPRPERWEGAPERGAFRAIGPPPRDAAGSIIEAA
jgi:hypothetical protein